MAAEARRRQNLRDSLTIIGALLGLYWFAASFFLAKKNLSLVSSCHEPEALLTQVLGLSEDHIRTLHEHRVLSRSSDGTRQGCWMPRRVDSVIILLVDALRFDFCLYNLPESVGSRLPLAADFHNTTTRLFRFVADPPTVTMQRLKALTTGGLPTFADISANFGGASLEEDSWVHQLMKNTHHQFASRGRHEPSKSAFVGDDTWLDLFPGLFTENYPYPSFNTRDLDTVDNGCIEHLPNLTRRFLSNELEVVIVHFLGVDHVGHTYGPHNQHMDAKLRQMDKTLADVLETMDSATSCQAALIFGDHGMTEDGNHGGGTEEEVSAALFVHVSPACGDMTEALSLERDSSLLWSASQTFASIHQIDLVPTLSMMLGIPIPFANLGSLVPSLLPGYKHLDVATSLALNAAQVWRYLTIYSVTANKLPIEELAVQLATAVSIYKDVLVGLHLGEVDVDMCNQSSGLLKLFLTEALALGQRVWTRFDEKGMIGGIAILLVALVTFVYPSFKSRRTQSFSNADKVWEVVLAYLSMIFLSGLLTFSNSYIYEEQQSTMYFMALMSLAVALRMHNDPKSATIWRGVLLIPIASRANELFISGHGLDPSIQGHMAHVPAIFLLSAAIAIAIRWCFYRFQITASFLQAAVDCLALSFLAASWWVKSQADPDQSGFMPCRIAFFWLFLGIPHACYELFLPEDEVTSDSPAVTALFKLAIAVTAVTGPSAASSVVLFAVQLVSLSMLSELSGSLRIHSAVVAVLCRLVTRHMFFATNHGCAFNRLQYSSAFIVTPDFYFALGGASLFINTFGWELMGLAFARLLSKRHGRSCLWRFYIGMQLLEALASCVSVSLLRRHLMVWDILAPHFLFVAVFTFLNGLWLVSCSMLRGE